MLFNIDYDVAAIILLLIIAIFYFYKSNLLNLNSKIFGVFLIVAILDVLLDIISVYTISYASSIPLWINLVVNILYFLLQFSLIFMFMIYCMALVGFFNRDNSKKILALSAPALLPLDLVFSSPFNNSIFYFDEQMNYQHGPLYNALYLFIAYFIFVGMFFVIYYRKRLRKMQFAIIVSYIVVFFIMMGIQYHFPTYLVTGASASLFLLTMYLTLQNPDSYLDIMTGLFGRKAFLLTVTALLKGKSEFDLVLIDLNNLKFVNNVFGIKSGDSLIIQIASFLEQLCSHKYVFRINGDQFAVLVMKDASNIIQMIQKRLNQGFFAGDAEILLAFRICKMPISKYASTPEEILTLVESTFVLLKKKGGNVCLELDPKTVDVIHRDFAVESALRNAIANKTLEVYFQPIISCDTGLPYSAEALLRLNDPELGFIPPDEFIIIAEQKGLINTVGEIVIEKSCAFLSQNRLWEWGIQLVHINLSTVQCMDIHLTEQILSTIEKFNLPDGILNFEITETAAIASQNQLLSTMNELLDNHISFSMDDYGSGFSNNKNLTVFPFDAIKLDKEMLWSCEENPKAYVLYQNVVNMIRQMSMKVIAEGVETEEQANMVKSIGVNYIQGYYYSKPLPPNDFLSYLRRFN